MIRLFVAVVLASMTYLQLVPFAIAQTVCQDFVVENIGIVNIIVN